MLPDPFRLQGVIVDGRYRVEDVIGEGGFGVVYRAFHLRFRHLIAVKCLKVPAHFTPDARQLFFDRFREEGAMLSHLSSHPAIVRVFDLGIAQAPVGVEVPYLVLEWLEGRPLDQWLDDRKAAGAPPLTALEALVFLRPAVEAIAAAHAQHIAHRDIKPANLFVLEPPRGATLKVLDFGVAKAMQEGESATQLATRTTSGFSAFSVQHGAPEQFWSKSFGQTGPWTDVHALGLTLVELTTGRPAYDGAETGDFFMAATAVLRPTPRSRGAQVPDAFEALCAKALALKPSNRFPNAASLLEAMDVVIAGRALPLSTPPVTGAPGSGPSSPMAVTPARGVPTTYAGPYLGGPPPLATSQPPPAYSQQLAYSQPPGYAQSSVRPPPGLYAPPPGYASPQGYGEPPIYVPQPPPVRASGPPVVLLAAILAGVVAVLGLGVIGVLATRARQSDLETEMGRGNDTDPKRVKEDNEAPPPSGPMVRVPGGTFQMGSTTGTDLEAPVHSVTVAPFELDADEVTVASYRACVRAGACTVAATPIGWGDNVKARDAWAPFCNYPRSDRASHPINCVDFTQAATYCRAVGKRLPTEEEWEFAARGGEEERTYPWGAAAPTSSLANGCGPECIAVITPIVPGHPPLYANDDGWPSTAPVRSFPAGVSRFGAYDLGGNVAEWTSTPFCSYASPGCQQSARVIRGGSWSESTARDLTGSARAVIGLNWGDTGDVGFRCAR